MTSERIGFLRIKKLTSAVPLKYSCLDKDFMKAFYYIFSVFYWVGIVGVTSVLFFPVAAVIKGLTFLFDKNLKILHMFTSFWGSIYTWVNPLWNVKTEGREKIRKDGVYVAVSNHFSTTDVFTVYRLFFHFKWVSKSENFKIPLIGWNMTLNRYIRLNRGSTKGNAQMMKDAEAALRQGSSVYIFPEGTRSTTNEVKEFKTGAFELAKRTKSPILPIVIEGSQNALPKKGVILNGRHNILIRVLDEIPYTEFEHLESAEIAEKVRALIAGELNKIRHPE